METGSGLVERYGYENGHSGYPLAAWLWGHRFRMGQHWIEYMLEFLNVLAGFDYELGQGLKCSRVSTEKEMYIRFRRIGLRRFVFYDEHEKTPHPHDDEARQRLLEHLCTEYVAEPEVGLQETLPLARSLLRSFSAVEEKRSWYAKSLIPAHHALLFWEATRKGATLRRSGDLSREDAQALSPTDLDREIRYDQRNFFARGGEIYYLILSAGTQHRLDRRRSIEYALKELLLKRNPALGKLAKLVDDAWTDLHVDDEAEEHLGRLGWIPKPDHPFYETVAEDVYTFLAVKLEPLEALSLLAHLICFHLTLYIYKHAAEGVAVGSTSENQGPVLLVDMLGRRDGGALRRRSASLFRLQESQIEENAKSYVSRHVSLWLHEATGTPEEQAAHTIDTAYEHFAIKKLGKSRRGPYEEASYVLQEDVQQGRSELDDFAERYAQTLLNVLMGDFRKNFLGVHRKLAKSIGFVAPLTGRNARFVLSDNLLKTISVALLGNTEITYDDYLRKLYQRYGIVVGLEQARNSGLIQRLRINAEYYTQNKVALLERLKHAGFAHEYSDATAMIKCSALTL